MKLARFLAATAAIALCGPLLASPSLTPHTAQYKVKISVVSGQLDTELRRTANGYVAHHVIRPTGLSKLITRGTMDVTSEFDNGPDGVMPVRYRAVDTIRDEPEVDLDFDWGTNEVSGTVGEENVHLKMEGIAHDSVSIQYQLMQDLLSGKPGKQYTLFDIDKLKVANVSDAGKKEVKTKAGNYMAVGVRHQKEGSSRITTLWCVEELGYLPVIIEQHRKGKLNFRATLVKYSLIQE